VNRLGQFPAGLVALLATLVSTAESVRVATYNLANDNPTDRQIEGAFLASYPKPDKEKTALRKVLHQIDADVLALQEVGGEDFLRELQRDLRKEGLNYSESVVLNGADDQRKVAILSRIPLTQVRRHTDFDFKYFEGRELVKRGRLEVRFETAAGEVALFVIHLKSRLTECRDDPEAQLRRGKEATAARDRILELFPEPQTSRFIIAGDFNEGTLQPPVRAFSKIGRRPISGLVPAEDSRGET
jgi:endonuclease/exonuclease/phosphatase family metal-dependent hydrolase